MMPLMDGQRVHEQLKQVYIYMVGFKYKFEVLFLGVCVCLCCVYLCMSECVRVYTASHHKYFLSLLQTKSIH